MDDGSWTTLPDGRQVWRLTIHSEQAAGLRVEFQDFSVGAGKVWIHSGETGGDVDGPYTDQGLYGNGDFWSGTVRGDNLVVEYEPEPGRDAQGAPPFRIRRIAHEVDSIVPAATAALSPRRQIAVAAVGPASSSAIGVATGDPAASCNLDPNCYPEWHDSMNSVAHIVFEETEGDQTGTFACSASLVATRNASFKPYLLTAGHCIHSEEAARSLQTFWTYQTSACNASPPAGKGALKSSNGGHLLASGALNQGDFSLVLLPDVPAGVVFAGWDTTDPALGQSLVGIHHPMGSYKRISFGHRVVSADVNIDGYALDGDLYTTVLFDNGITQPGSSGSPLFSSPGIVVGMLTYGPEAPGEVLCRGGDFGAYGKFSNAYLYLEDYLEDLPYTIVKPSAGTLKFSGVNGGFAGGASQSVNLTTQSANPVEFQARADAPWLRLSAASGSASASTPFQLAVSVDPRYLTQTDTYTSTVTILSGAAPPQYINVRVDMSIETSNVVVTASPNPVPQTMGTFGPEWRLKLRLEEHNGVPTTLTGLRIDGSDYSTAISNWFGSNQIAASGAIEATIWATGLAAQSDKYFEFVGLDPASGKTWYKTLVVKFTLQQ